LYCPSRTSALGFACALENFQITGVPIHHYPSFIKGLAMVKLAAARALTKTSDPKVIQRYFDEY